MIAETTLAGLLKATTAVGGSAWVLSVCEGNWLAAAVAAPALMLCGKETWRISRRLRGKRAEGRT